MTWKFVYKNRSKDQKTWRAKKMPIKEIDFLDREAAYAAAKKFLQFEKSSGIEIGKATLIWEESLVI